MPKITHDRSLHSSAPRLANKPEKDVFAKAEETSFVDVPKVSLNIDLLQNNIKALNQIPTKLDVPEPIDKRPQPLAKKEKRKQKKEAFLKRLEPFAQRPTTQKNKTEKQNNNNQNKLSLNTDDFMGALGDLSDDERKSSGNGTSATMTNRKKKKIALKEIEQYKNVLSHPQFQSDPFSTLKEHLTNSVQIQNEKLEEQNKLRITQNKIMNKGNGGTREKKKKEKKSNNKSNPYYDSNKMDLN